MGFRLESVVIIFINDDLFDVKSPLKILYNKVGFIWGYMIVFIDVYNVMKLFFFGRGEQFFKEKNLFIKSIGAYFNEKKTSINKIIIFFDGGTATHMTREVKNNVIVMHAGTRMSADDAMVDAVKKYQQKELVMVTNDRKLIARIHALHAAAIVMESEAFWELVCKTIGQSKIEHKNNIAYSHGLKKFEQYDDTDAQNIFGDLDFLMSMASMSVPEKNEDDEKKAAMKKGKKKDILQDIIKKL